MGSVASESGRQKLGGGESEGAFDMAQESAIKWKTLLLQCIFHTFIRSESHQQALGVVVSHSEQPTTFFFLEKTVKAISCTD